MKLKNKEASIGAIMKKEAVSREEATELLQSLLDAGLIFEDDASGEAEDALSPDESLQEEYLGNAVVENQDYQLIDELVDVEMARDLARQEQNPEAYQLATARRKDVVARIRKRALDPMMTPPGGGPPAGPGANPGVNPLHNPGGSMGVMACPSCGQDNVKVANQNDPSMPSTMQCENCGYAWQETPGALAKKQALDQPQSIEQDRDLYTVDELQDPDTDIKNEAYNLMLGQFPDSDPEVINAAINEAWVMAEKEGLRKDAQEIVRVAQMYAGVGDAQALARFAYILARNSVRPLDCPMCHSKVSRKRDNPMHFYCPNGHVSKISLRKSAAPADILSGDELGTNDNPLDDQGQQPQPQTPVPDPQQPQPNPDQNGLTLSQDERNRINGVMYQVQEQAATPFMILGVADGFFEQDTYAELCQSQEDLSEYQFGRREGKQAKGGDFTPGVG